MSQRYWLKLHLQETNSYQLDDAVLEKLSDVKFDSPNSLHDLRHFVKNLVGMCRLLFFKDSAITLQTSTWIDRIDQKEMLYEMQFDIDPLFGLKTCLIVDRAIQNFLNSCQESEDLDKVNFCYLDSSFDQECIEKGRFSCNLPPLLLELLDAATPRIQNEGVGGVKRQRRNALSNPKQEDAGENKAELVQNPDKN